jgi:hypothetical protein
LIVAMAKLNSFWSNRFMVGLPACRGREKTGNSMQMDY